MRLGALVCSACYFILPAFAAAQGYSLTNARSTTSVIRPAAYGPRNYVAVPDGPCGCPMSVQTDCYKTCRPCGPLHPACFLHRVGRMLDGLLPCNMCCRSGCGGGGAHGCGLGGRTWGHCNVCCGDGCGSCRPNPCGSAFADVCGPSCTTGGHCIGCGTAVPALSDPFQDDPQPPKPTAQPSSEVRRAPAANARLAGSHARTAPAPSTSAAQPQSSAYKVVTKAAAANSQRQASSQSVLRRTSVEREISEPATLQVDQSEATPLPPLPKSISYGSPKNPLR